MDEGIQVDITNPEDIRAKRANVQERIREAQADLKVLKTAEAALNAALGERPQDRARREEQEADRAPSSKELTLATLERIGAPAKPREVADLIGDDVNPKTVGWVLWQAANDGDVQKISKGIYAPLSYRAEDLIPRLNGTPSTEGDE